jgi:glucokinase
MGIGLANLQKIFDPDMFVIGGGMSQVGAFYFDKIQAYADRFELGFPQIKISVAELGTDAGVIGAAAVAAT